ncbi:MAG: LamG domain-containing protein, partial [Candidatus Omnitrophica bacterium]|nr:LamG domain-containing protein [Candidatus Omnitrophota bacterium]
DAGDGVDLTDGGYDLSVYGNITIENVAALVVSTGTWKQMANGNISNPNAANDIYTYQVSDGFTATATGNFWVDEDLVLGDSSTLTLTGYSLGMYPDNNDFITIGTASIISGGTIDIRGTGDLTHGVLTIPTVTIKPSNVNDASITLTGNWSIDDFLISGTASSDTESEAMTVDTSTYNLTLAGTLTLGDDTGSGYWGKIDFGSGTHTIAENIDVSGTTNTWGIIDLDNAQLSVAGNVDLNRSTVYQGLGTVTFNAADTGNTIDSWTQTFNDVVFNNAAGGWILTSGMMVADDFTMTNTAAAGIVLDGYELTVGDNFILTTGSLFANRSTIIIKGNWDSQAGTFEPGVSTVVFNGTDLDNTITTNAESFSNININDGMIGYWKLDESSTTENVTGAIDSSGHGYHGTWRDDASSSTNTPDVNFVDNYAIELDGTGDWIDSNLPGNLLPQITVSCWFYSHDAGTIAGDSVPQRLITQWRSTESSRLGLGLTENQTLGLLYQGTVSTTLESTATLSANKWYHAAGTYDGTTVRLYLNGVLHDSGVSTLDSPSVDDIRIGVYAESHGTPRFFDGLIDDFRIYNRALTAAEVARLAHGDQPQTATGKYTLQDALNVDGDLTLATGTLDVSGQDINVQESWWNYGGILEEETQSVTFDGGTSGHVIQSGSETFYNLTVSGASGVWTLYDDLEVSNTFNITNGTLTHSTDLPLTEIKANTTINGGTFTGVASSIANVGNLTLSSGQYTTPSKFLTITENFTHTAGTLTASSGTIVFTSDDTSNTIDQNAQAFNNVIISDGLIAYWKLDETAEGGCPGGVLDACDSSGFGNHGEWQDDPTASTDMPKPFRFSNDRSLDFDGTGDFITVAYDSAFALNEYTFASWTMITAAPGTLGVFGTRSGGDFTFDLKIQAAVIHGDVGDGSAWLDTTADCSTTLDQNVWNHIAYAVAKDETKIYLNGSLCSTQSYSGTPLLMQSGQTMRIGHTGSGTEIMNGNIDDVRIYNRALSADEIKALAQSEVYGDNDTTYTLLDALDANGDITLSQGTLITSSQNINVGGSWENINATYTGAMSSVTFDSTSGDQNITSNGYTFYNIVLNNTDALSSTDDIVLQDALNIDNDITVSDGDLYGGNYTINVGGLWTMAAPGNFTAGASTVEFDDASKVTTIYGSTTFYEMLINTASKRVDWEAGTTNTVSHAFTVDGQATGTMVDFNSTTPGTQWTINTPVANAFVNYLNVQDSVSANATMQALNSVD